MAAIRFAIYCFICIFSVSISYADSCATNIPGHYPNRFDDHKNGTVTDKMTGLMWSKCILGMSWDGSDCVGPKVDGVENRAPSLSWQDTLKAATTANYGGFSGWRVPNIKEIASLFDVACMSNRHAYAMDIDVLDVLSHSNDHNSAASSYWSSTPSREVTYDASDVPHNQAWQMNFRDGQGLGAAAYPIDTFDTKDKNGAIVKSEQKINARLVRGDSQ